MKRLTIPLLALAAGFGTLTLAQATLAAEPTRSSGRTSTQGRSADHSADQLNAVSLERARNNQNSPTTQPDTTGNLNRMSDQDARTGHNTGNQPMMPFR